MTDAEWLTKEELPAALRKEGIELGFDAIKKYHRLKLITLVRRRVPKPKRGKHPSRTVSVYHRGVIEDIKRVVTNREQGIPLSQIAQRAAEAYRTEGAEKFVDSLPVEVLALWARQLLESVGVIEKVEVTVQADSPKQGLKGVSLRLDGESLEATWLRPIMAARRDEALLLLVKSTVGQPDMAGQKLFEASSRIIRDVALEYSRLVELATAAHENSDWKSARWYLSQARLAKEALFTALPLLKSPEELQKITRIARKGIKALIAGKSLPADVSRLAAEMQKETDESLSPGEADPVKVQEQIREMREELVRRGIPLRKN